jgi:hypothetical protein
MVKYGVLFEVRAKYLNDFAGLTISGRAVWGVGLDRLGAETVG